MQCPAIFSGADLRRWVGLMPLPVIEKSKLVFLQERELRKYNDCAGCPHRI